MQAKRFRLKVKVMIELFRVWGVYAGGLHDGAGMK